MFLVWEVRFSGGSKLHGERVNIKISGRNWPQGGVEKFRRAEVSPRDAIILRTKRVSKMDNELWTSFMEC